MAESEQSNVEDPADRRGSELDDQLQRILIELEPYRGKVSNGPVDYGQLATLLATSGGVGLVIREAIRQRGETQRERIRQEGMTQRALLTGRANDAIDTTSETRDDATGDGGSDPN
ncbi:hypothetical protein ACFP2T_39490 [Plantactinospora solaniradicis]|uniref:Uncharacterized protein n=1 Tax=Plantactinospora solaniradicis TaxID=1723736 RepID=A0ABW1KMU5_9ACTN